MRGKRCGVAAAVVTYRIIPAHAGQTTPIVTAWYRTPDHPRACGANRRTRWALVSAFGSSPRMRGKLGLNGDAGLRGRIIPAHAGQTRGLAGTRHQGADHPRACGANWNCSRKSANCAGSSPRMRGKPIAGPDVVFQGRIIPAHAGQTSCST